MPPKLLSDDGSNVVIRPLAYCRGKGLRAFARYKEFPLIPCNPCGSQENLQRVRVTIDREIHLPAIRAVNL